ncbi:glycoside hydrolase family 15 protein [Candidatus Nitrosacidococcus sp. I8]|uniref:glycoside hydrolase family 15 protein n=1 Tax=Candidatus Nitrosacidococcus sp. I8 TaxID=2942908 RepID=UPI0022273FEC|nr:glycoside hydrolase family 15 protein [Candidatus Nitrosacidococcus sp. I8]CAH9017571.1 Trehalase [Candidatus Nitrosacidococcus sp. I8]
MGKLIEDYGLIGNMVSCALVGIDGSIDWLCLPHFDSDACFAALLGTPDHGRWLIAPKEEIKNTTRHYLPNTPILETTFETETGAVCVTDFMPLSTNEKKVELLRIVRGIRGQVDMEMDIVLRFRYGETVPWVRQTDYGIRAISGPDTVELLTPIPLYGENMKTRSRFTVTEGSYVPFTLTYHPSQEEPRFISDSRAALTVTSDWWQEWASRCYNAHASVPPEWRDAIVRSLITLKVMTFQPTGGIVAAPTTSLPEEIGGERQWDYRFCWIRDSALALHTFLSSGYIDEAKAFREWLLRAAAGHPEQMQIMYGLRGERRLTEEELPWLPGYENSRPVRIGNGAYRQKQLDIYGELMNTTHLARMSQIGSATSWQFQCTLLRNLEENWHYPDEGIWEIRSDQRHFTHSKMMCWVAFDRAVKAIEIFGLEGPLDKWKQIREEIKTDILTHGYDSERNTFTQTYGHPGLDASLLLLGKTGFLEPTDPRFIGTVEAIERELIEDGFVLRYRPEESTDGLSGNEGAFLVCSFWLADAYALIGRHNDAVVLFNRLLSIRNDLGLLAEEYHPGLKRQLGNFPQAFSHVGLIDAAHHLLQSYVPQP